MNREEKYRTLAEIQNGDLVRVCYLHNASVVRIYFGAFRTKQNTQAEIYLQRNYKFSLEDSKMSSANPTGHGPVPLSVRQIVDIRRLATLDELTKEVGAAVEDSIGVIVGVRNDP